MTVPLTFNHSDTPTEVGEIVSTTTKAGVILILHSARKSDGIWCITVHKDGERLKTLGYADEAAARQTWAGI